MTAFRACLRRLPERGDAGSSTAEMALLTPLLVMLLLFVVLCGRLVSAQLDVNAAASGAARAASLARTEATGRSDAQRVAAETLADQGTNCQETTVQLNADGWDAGGRVSVTITCRVALSDLLLLGIPGERTVVASATSPIDQWRGTGAS